MPGLVEIPTRFHYIMEEQKAVPNPETCDSLKGSESTASCRAASLFPSQLFIEEQVSASVMGICIGSSAVPLTACLSCADAPGQSSRVFPRVSITVT